MINPWTFGFGFMAGATTFVALILMAITLLKPHDSTDAPGQRSGINVYTDHKSGMQYLSTPNGGITPRLDKHGQQMRVKP